MLKRRMLALFLTCALIWTTGIPTMAQEGGGFSDVPSNHWAFGAIQWMTQHKILAGVGDNRFQPDAVVTREQFASMMVKALDLTVPANPVSSFLDVSNTQWSCAVIEGAKPYLTGFRTDAGDYFKPGQPAVREDMAVALVKALHVDVATADESVLGSYGDQADISTNLRKFVALAVSKGIIAGYDKNGIRVFAPQENLTRAQASVLVYNALRVDGEKVTYGEDKVTYGTPTPTPAPTVAPTPKPSSLPVPKVAVTTRDGKLLVTWNSLTGIPFHYYKVVLSKSDSTPQYPENGYYEYISDPSRTYSFVEPGHDYNGGDIGTVTSGETYYVTITAVFEKGKTTGNVIKVVMP